MDKKDNNIRCDINIRLPKDNKPYYEYQLKEFCNHFSDKKYAYIQFGKQDIRGTESITFIDHKHCVPLQKFFHNKFELLGFVSGYNANANKHNEFKGY